MHCYLCVSDHGGQKRESDSLEPKLWRFWAAWCGYWELNWETLWKISKCSWPPTCPSLQSPNGYFFSLHTKQMCIIWPGNHFDLASECLKDIEIIVGSWFLPPSQTANYSLMLISSMKFYVVLYEWPLAIDREDRGHQTGRKGTSVFEASWLRRYSWLCSAAMYLFVW